MITEEAIRALTGLPEGGIYTIDNPTPEQLIRYFGEYSLASKGYQTQGGGDMLFREIARVLHEYSHVYPRPLVMPQNRAGMIIATYEGIKVDWPVLIADDQDRQRQRRQRRPRRTKDMARRNAVAHLACATRPARPAQEARKSGGRHPKDGFQTTTVVGL